MTSYKIVRMYFDSARNKKTLRTGLTLEEAQSHCKHPETSSRTATSSRCRARTARLGQWFDAYTKE